MWDLGHRPVRENVFSLVPGSTCLPGACALMPARALLPMECSPAIQTACPTWPHLHWLGIPSPGSHLRGEIAGHRAARGDVPRGLGILLGGLASREAAGGLERAAGAWGEPQTNPLTAVPLLWACRLLSISTVRRPDRSHSSRASLITQSNSRAAESRYLEQRPQVTFFS